MEKKINTLPYKSIFLDVDSTLVQVEGLVEIAKRKGVYHEVAEITEAGMNGAVPFIDSLEKRLDLVQPNKQDLEWLGDWYCLRLTPGAEEMISVLHRQGVTVFLLSGSYTEALIPLAVRLNIPLERVFGVSLNFDFQGNYQGFDKRQMLVGQNGKTMLLKSLSPQRRIAFLGDGASDLETKDYVDTFIGFGGVQHRKFVEEAADYFVFQNDLRYVLQWLLEPIEPYD